MLFRQYWCSCAVLRYGYIRGKTRASMADDTAANNLLTSELEDVIGDVCLSFNRVYTLRV